MPTAAPNQAEPSHWQDLVLDDGIRGLRWGLGGGLNPYSATGGVGVGAGGGAEGHLDSGDSLPVAATEFDLLDESGVIGEPGTPGYVDSSFDTEADRWLSEGHAMATAMHKLYAQGKYNEAFQVGRRALARFQALQEPAGSCDALMVLSAACMEHEQGFEALTLVRHAFRLARVHALPAALESALTLMARLHGRMKDFAGGESLALQALSRARERHDPSAVMGALDSLLSVLLEASAGLFAADEAEHTQASAQRMLRYAQQLLAQTEQVPTDPAELMPRIRAGAALLVNGQVAESQAVQRGCMEAARRHQLRIPGAWARLYTAQAVWLDSRDTSLLTASRLLLPQLVDGDPPQLRLAVMGLLAEVARNTGRVHEAHRLRVERSLLHAAIDLQIRAIEPLLQRNADDTLAALAVVDREWLESGLPQRQGRRRAADHSGDQGFEDLRC